MKNLRNQLNIIFRTKIDEARVDLETALRNKGNIFFPLALFYIFMHIPSSINQYLLFDLLLYNLLV